jgi:hypothetical protein
VMDEAKRDGNEKPPLHSTLIFLHVDRRKKDRSDLH